MKCHKCELCSNTTTKPFYEFADINWIAFKNRHNNRTKCFCDLHEREGTEQLSKEILGQKCRHSYRRYEEGIYVQIEFDKVISEFEVYNVTIRRVE